MNKVLVLSLLALTTVGCLSIKTESEIKPIHITMDVNLKVDKELDKAFADENQQSARGDYRVIKDLLARQAAGMTNRAMLEARTGATDDDQIAIIEENAKRLKRFREIAKSSGATIESVQKRQAAKLREKLPAGTWLQSDAGVWAQK